MHSLAIFEGVLGGSLMHLSQVICTVIATAGRQAGRQRNCLIYGYALCWRACSYFLSGVCCATCQLILAVWSSFLTGPQGTKAFRIDREKAQAEKTEVQEWEGFLPWLQAQKSSQLSSFAQLLGSGYGGESSFLSVGWLVGYSGAGLKIAG